MVMAEIPITAPLFSRVEYSNHLQYENDFCSLYRFVYSVSLTPHHHHYWHLCLCFFYKRIGWVTFPLGRVSFPLMKLG